MFYINQINKLFEVKIKRSLFRLINLILVNLYSMSNYIAVKVNALGSPCVKTVTNFDNIDEHRIYSQVKDLLHTDDIEVCHYHFWCEDGQRRVFSAVFDGNGLGKQLYPNHWVNAMIHAGRFTTKSFDNVDDNSRNQQIKESQASNYVVGDVVILVPSEDAPPDSSIVGVNPYSFIARRLQPGTSMVSKHGAVVAAHKIDYRMKIQLFHDESGMSMRWVSKQYHILPPVPEGGRSCYDQNYLSMVQSWGFDV